MPFGRATWLVLGLGALFSLYLLSLVHPEVFMSGDGGVKLLLVKQFASGNMHSDLRLAAEPWVGELWATGLYPLSPPFAYQVGSTWYAGFPIFPSLAAAPFYAAFGYWGLYVLPTLALWATWLVLAWLCRKLELNTATTMLVLLTVIFASPLTVYGAIFWEHTLGVALATAGLVSLVRPSARPRASEIWAGVLLGLSTWFRSELLCFAGVVAIIVAVSGGFAGRRALTLGAIAVTCGTLFALNMLMYGQFLGVHGEQIVGGEAQALQPATIDKLLSLSLLLLRYFPVVLPVAVLTFVAPRTDVARLLAIACGAFLLLVPAIVPNDGGRQWGPRYLLVLIPALAMLAGIQLSELPHSRLRRLCGAGMIAAIGWGSFVNVIGGSQALSSDYTNRISPVLDVVTTDPAHVVVVTQQWIGQELAAAWAEKSFFKAEDSAALTRIAAALSARGDNRFLFLSPQPVAGTWHVRANGAVLEMHAQRLFARGRIFVQAITMRPVT